MNENDYLILKFKSFSDQFVKVSSGHTSYLLDAAITITQAQTKHVSIIYCIGSEVNITFSCI